MSKIYLPTEESIGYKNLKQAYETFFGAGSFPEVKEHDFEDFGFRITLMEQEMSIAIIRTEKGGMYNFGEGGILQLAFIDNNSPRLFWEILKKRGK